MVRRALAGLGALFVIGVLLAGGAVILRPLERDAALGRTAVRIPVDLNSAHVVTWDVPSANWPYKEGEARLALVLQRAAASPCEVKGRSPLKLVVGAMGTVESGRQYDRLIRNWYYTTDEPLAPDAKLWESWGPEGREYGLGGVSIYPFERVRVSLDVRTPDPALAACKPQLQLLPAVDYAIAEHLPWLRVFRDGLTGSSVGVVLALAWYASRRGGDA